MNGEVLNVIEVNDCIMSLDWRTEGMIAGGWSGAVWKWNDKELKESQGTGNELQGHRECVTEVKWIEVTKASWAIMSTSTDGKILIWDAQLRFPSRGYLMIRKKNNEIGVVGTICTS